MLLSLYIKHSFGNDMLKLTYDLNTKDLVKKMCESACTFRKSIIPFL